MRIRQIVFAVQQLQPARELLAKLFQLSTPFRDPGVAEFGIDNAVFSFGDQFIELISPTRDGTACGRHLARQGDSGYMLLLQTADLAQERTRFTALGVRSIWSTDFDDISAMHLHPKDVGAAIVSVDEPRPASSWRWGGPPWQGDQTQRASDRQGVRGITLRAREPETLARRWAQVFGRPEPTRQGECWRVALTDGFADVEASADGSDGVSGFTLAVSDPAAVLARAHAAGLAVVDRQITWLGTTLSLQAA
jgi:hypothetical protein